MALKVDYAVRETGSNLARNLTITIASVLTVAVSLALVGFSLMLRSAVSNATERWQGGIEFVVFLQADATPEQIESVGNELANSPDVEQITFVDKQAAYEEFKRLFADSPEMVDTVEPDILPPQYKVVPLVKEADLVEQLGTQFAEKPGVLRVVFAHETIRVLQNFSSWVTGVVLLIAVILLLSAGLLILNTIRMAMYARRREIEVMKLVGATNWFIRVPFMLEGLVQGVVGAILAIGLLAGLWPFFQQSLPNPNEFALLRGFEATTPETVMIYALIGAIGCIVGAVGAGIAVTRFLDI
jgi:cell division transport system permease protein